jgi:mannosyltransferase OCH1-like enzyme
MALPMLNSQGLINDAVIVCDVLKDVLSMPMIHFETPGKNCRQGDYIFVNLDITDFESLFQNLNSPRTILCKNFMTLEILEREAPKDFDIIYTGFTSIDRFDPSIAMDYSKIIHIAGKSSFKGTKKLVKTWILHPEWPILTIICRESVSQIVKDVLPDDIPNIIVINKHIDEDELNYYYNSSGVHICTSNHEGFGHYLNEAKACQAVVVYTNGSPMNELFEDGVTGLSVNTVADGFSGNGLCSKVNFQEEDLEETIAKLLSLDSYQKQTIGYNARQNYLNQKTEFKKKIKNIIMGDERIPKVIHTMWISKDKQYGESLYPDKYKEHVETWLEKNPDFRHLHWTGEEIYNLIREYFPEYLDLYQKIQPVIRKCDFARFVVIAVYGGLYHDLDFYCLENVSPLLQGRNYFVMEPREHGQKLFNGFFGSTPNDGFVIGWLSKMVDNIQNEGIFGESTLKITGPEGLYEYYTTSKDIVSIGNSCDVTPYTDRRKISSNCSLDTPFAYTVWHNGSDWGGKRKDKNIHILHPMKTGGLSIRKALGCNCKDKADEDHGERELGTAGCQKTTRKGKFICHGHGIKCKDIPKEDPYVVIVRDPEDRAKSWMKYFRRDIKSDKQFEKDNLYSYMDCPNNPPDMILHTKTLDEDYQEFKRRFCLPGECADSISHYHDSKKDPSDYQVKFGPEEREYVRKVWTDDYVFSKDNLF